VSHLNELCEPEYEEADFYDLASAKGATRSWSDEVDFGARWRDSDSRGNTYRLSWLRATGELVVVRAADRKITLLGVVADEDELKRVLSGWSDICGTVRSFGWLRSRVAATDWSRAWVPVGARRACAGFKIRPFPAGHRIYIVPGAPDVYGDIASITISLNELGPFISRARETLENIERALCRLWGRRRRPVRLCAGSLPNQNNRRGPRRLFALRALGTGSPVH
jgi:hypothetical protein